MRSGEQRPVAHLDLQVEVLAQENLLLHKGFGIVAPGITAKYGIKVKAWRSGSEGVLQKIVSEAKGNRFDADIVQNDAPENEAAHREKLLQEVKSPYAKDLMPAASPVHHEWVGFTLDVYIAAYNTNNRCLKHCTIALLINHSRGRSERECGLVFDER